VYTLHRNPDVFKEPDTFIPERWLNDDPELKRWWWAFSSGGRMCIGEQLPINPPYSSNRSLAIAEISALAAAVYLQYRTSLVDTTYSPGINSRFELFFDQRFTSVKVTPAPVILIVARMLD
jgi:cytochrome P450